MGVKTWHIAAVLVIGGFIWSGSNGGDIKGAVAELQQGQQVAAGEDDRDKAERDRLRQMRKLSKVALDRYRAGCEFATHAATGADDAIFHPGDVVAETSAAGRVLADGTVICNRAGHTAVISNGTAQDVASVALDDYQAFTALLKQIEALKGPQSRRWDLPPSSPAPNQLPLSPIVPVAQLPEV
jgi:hypothetical protein